MKVFFDTEFTGLHKLTTLISIGLVDEEGNAFYAEFDDYDESQCDDWIKKNVLNHLQLKEVGVTHRLQLKEDGATNKTSNLITVKGCKALIKDALADWLSKYDTVELVSDCCHYDMVLFIDLFGTAFDIPENVTPTCHDINQDIARFCGISAKEAFDKSREKILENNFITIDGDKHNSLYDAKVIKEISYILDI